MYLSYSTMMKLGTVILFVKKIQKIHESRDTPLEFYPQAFFYYKSTTFVISRKRDKDGILIYNF